MSFLVNLKNKISAFFRDNDKNKPWLEYYSREERSIKFTNKSIYFTN